VTRKNYDVVHAVPEVQSVIEHVISEVYQAVGLIFLRQLGGYRDVDVLVLGQAARKKYSHAAHGTVVRHCKSIRQELHMCIFCILRLCVDISVCSFALQF